MVFGQGAIRCHPYIGKEIAAAQHNNHDLGTDMLDEAIYAHGAHAVRNGLRSLLLAFAGGMLEDVPFRADLERYYRQIGRFSAVLALLTDTALLSIGGGLKAQQRFSGRMADTLTQLYYASAGIKYWHDQEYPTEQRPLVEWCLQRCLFDAQNALRAAVDNFPVQKLRRPLRWLAFPPLCTRLKAPEDALGKLVAQSMVEDTPLREHLSAGCYRNEQPDDPVGRVLHAYRLAQDTAEARAQLLKGLKHRAESGVDAVDMLLGHQRAELVDWAVGEGLVSAEQRDALVAALEAIYEADLVDAFEEQSLRKIADCSRGRLRLVPERSAIGGTSKSPAEEPRQSPMDVHNGTAGDVHPN
jgi:acyl-CoA dehydrogenase